MEGAMLPAIIIFLYMMGWLNTTIGLQRDLNFRLLPTWVQSTMLALWPIIVPAAVVWALATWITLKVHHGNSHHF